MRPAGYCSSTDDDIDDVGAATSRGGDPMAGLAITDAACIDAIREDDVVVLLWCGLRDHNAIGRFASLDRGTHCVRMLASQGFDHASMSTVVLLTDGEMHALVGIHSDDRDRVYEASALMRAADAQVCCF
jgi:hypothetical protein